jgi:hypothetical protein
MREVMGVVGFLLIVWALVILAGDLIRQAF